MTDQPRFNLLDPFANIDLGIADRADGIKDWATANRAAIQPFKRTVTEIIQGFEAALQSVPSGLMVLMLALLAWQAAGRRTGILVFVALLALGFLGPNAWPLAMTTLAIVLSAVLICAVIGLPLGILAAKSDRFERAIRPVLDTMQTIPAFVYLVPVVMLVGIGNVSGVIVTIVFALPPLIRLTALGIRQVDTSVVEAARAFGAGPLQILFKVELPLATSTIMAGLNQTIMLSLSMVVIASMIAVKGLGNEVLRAMGRLDAGQAIVGGLGIVILAVVLDRITQGLGQSGRHRGHRHWWQGGPLGLVLRVLSYPLRRSPVAEISNTRRN
ncbi:ABC transporter permease subunit [Pseudohalocynthiibacter aestuariivivens]|uniref:ABC transporter permease subunit n=1 Tax=Roseovarius pelagicus TaxID=2980108 RepID=A0ABY6D9N7_9RHOB|nr:MULTISPECIES: ABC transporter permease subunit [Rhodobacterales]QIE45235.1 ABC transporter permease subunit [Pseudohalocynthiibacter aestuariivivens]UXX82857.1 ABC transporter permease subunit [Roseovarius pelagicus]